MTAVSEATVHIVPMNDAIEHLTNGDDCPCGPETTAAFREDGSNGWLVGHHSLDAREISEGLYGVAMFSEGA